MEKVTIQIFGRTAIVDADMVKKMQRKEALVNRSAALREACDLNPELNADFSIYLERQEIAKKIINLNRTIRQNVRFL